MAEADPLAPILFPGPGTRPQRQPAPSAPADAPDTATTPDPLKRAAHVAALVIADLLAACDDPAVDRHPRIAVALRRLEWLRDGLGADPLCWHCGTSDVVAACYECDVLLCLNCGRPDDDGGAVYCRAGC
jgi:hypothetical protein